jgi:lysophospholipase L1-like esterase
MKLSVAAVHDKIVVTNAGYNGNNTADLLLRLDKDVLSKHPQLVVLMIGTNDMLNLRNMLSVKEYEENYQKLISLIKKHSKLILMTIPPVNSEYILKREDPKVYQNTSPQAKVDSANAVIRELAVKNKCHLVDLYKILQGCGGSTTDKASLFQNEANADINDGVHPTANGYLVIGTAVFQAVNLLEPKATSVVCFGDSITFGYKMQGQGTTQGQPYPAVLSRLLNQ